MWKNFHEIKIREILTASQKKIVIVVDDDYSSNRLLLLKIAAIFFLVLKKLSCFAFYKISMILRFDVLEFSINFHEND